MKTRISKKEREEAVVALQAWLEAHPNPNARLVVEVEGETVRYTSAQLVSRIKQRTRWGSRMLRYLKRNALKAGFSSIVEHLNAMKEEWDNLSEEERERARQVLENM